MLKPNFSTCRLKTTIWVGKRGAAVNWRCRHEQTIHLYGSTDDERDVAWLEPQRREDLDVTWRARDLRARFLRSDEL